MNGTTMLTAAAYGEAHGLSLRQVQRYLAEARLPGADKVGGKWLIPADARPLEHGATSSDVVPVTSGGIVFPPLSYDVAPTSRLRALDDVAAELGTTVGGVRRLGRDGHLVVGPYGPRGALRVFEAR